MDTSKLKKFAQYARRILMDQVSAKLKLVLEEGSAARRENPEAVEKLEGSIKQVGKDQVVERVAYTWFNRFCALRFMDVNRYTRIGIVSPAEGRFQPEILADAKMGHIDEATVSEKIRNRIFAFLDGKAPSPDPQAEAYRLLVVAACNDWFRAMPFLFERIHDYTELLMPDDLLSGNSILAYTREALTPDVCRKVNEDGSEEPIVEVIGWLYQFYISEKKDQVFEGLKKNKKITPENIPAATQLFTPHWIVRYLVENSLGRLWMLNRPNSRLIDRMDYYIKPEEPETDFLKISGPEEIKICDPACGSGHMLVYAFELLYAIYEEEGYEPSEIPQKILFQNLYGIEIDERAGTLAAFALVMKARGKQRRFFRKPVQPNICVLENVHFEEGKLKAYMDFVGRDLFTGPLQNTLLQFEEADNFGSLIRPEVTDVEWMRKTLEDKNVSEQLFLSHTHPKVLRVLEQVDYLSSKYHVVIANPPYMGAGGMNTRLKNWAKKEYQYSKSDLMTAFMERSQNLSINRGYIGMINLPSWMFLGTYEKFRLSLLNDNNIISLIHLGRGIFGSDFGSVAFIFRNSPANEGVVGVYRKLFDKHVDVRDVNEIERLFQDRDHGLFKVYQKDLLKIPGAPISYWVGKQIGEIFDTNPSMAELADVCAGHQTGENERFLRQWFEVSRNNFLTSCRSREGALESGITWFPHKKGGEFRRWYGNSDLVINWRNDGELIRAHSSSALRNADKMFKEGVTWSHTTSGAFGARYSPEGNTFNVEGPTLFCQDPMVILALLCSKAALELIHAMGHTIHFLVGTVSQVPVKLDEKTDSQVRPIAKSLVDIGQTDWDTYETSWDFTSLSLLNPDFRQPTLKTTFQKLRTHWQETTLEMQRLEEENNRIFIEAYGLQDELTPEVPLNEITLTCNPHYRYGGKKTEEELEALLLADTMREFISYAVGCMFGRYALEKPGLILANQGETLADFIRKVCSGEWEVDSKGEKNGNCSELQRVDRLAKSHEIGGTGLSGNETVPKGGALRADESGSPVGGFHSIQHSGRSGQKIDSGVSEFLVDCQRFKSRDGDPNPACPALELCNERYSTTNFESFRGSHPSAERTDEKPQITPHSPLPTPHFSTTHCPLSTIHFLPDEDNVIPMLDGDWFTDDITERFRKFLRITFGDEHYEENLQFIEEAIGKDIRKYFLKDFYTDHVKRYKKRPVYWMFSSPKGNFNALIYMHRYRPDTISVILNGYLREFRTKLSARLDHLKAVDAGADTSKSEKTKALKEIENLKTIIQELDAYERDVLFPLATRQVDIDLDDGVKVNYNKFDVALKKIPGLTA